MDRRKIEVERKDLPMIEDDYGDDDIPEIDLPGGGSNRNVNEVLKNIAKDK